jgi:hypothetical protein
MLTVLALVVALDVATATKPHILMMLVDDLGERTRIEATVHTATAS